MTRPRRFFGSVSFYPVTAVYTITVVVVTAVAGQLLRPDVALVTVALVAVIAIQLSMRREVAKVHSLVNSQRDELVARIDQLTATLLAAGVTVPKGEGGTP